MAHKTIFIADPGIDASFAIALALLDPTIELIGLAPSAGNIPAQQATINVHTLITQLDPRRWPRLGSAPAVVYDVNGTAIHGYDGLGNVRFPEISLHSPPTSDRLIVELIRQFPDEVTIVCLGPATVLAGAIKRDRTIIDHIRHLVLLGGAWHEPGNATAAAEFHFYCDPEAARSVLHAGLRTTLVPLDIMRKLVFSPKDLLDLPCPEAPTSQFLRKIVPFGIRASSNLYGIEGFHLKDVLGVAAVALTNVLTTKPYYVNVETRGELTRGMSVVDCRTKPAAAPNVNLAIGVDIAAVRDYIFRTLRRQDDAME